MDGMPEMNAAEPHATVKGLSKHDVLAADATGQVTKWYSSASLDLIMAGCGGMR